MDAWDTYFIFRDPCQALQACIKGESLSGQEKRNAQVMYIDIHCSFDIVILKVVH